jgi:NAD-dependent DNA ligase
MAAGFTSIPQILKMTKADFETVEGFKEKTIEKIYNGIHTKLKAASLLTIMAASNLFGRGMGERKIKLILDAYPDILQRPDGPREKIDLLLGIKGIGTENSNSFVENIPVFIAFLKECDLYDKVESKPLENKMELGTSDSTHPLYQKHIVMTKVRDAKIIEALQKFGGVLDNSMTKSTFVLIVKSKEDKTNKTEYAEKHGIPIMTPDEFITKYL